MCGFFKQKTAYDLRISDWSSDVCSSDLAVGRVAVGVARQLRANEGVAPRPPGAAFLERRAELAQREGRQGARKRQEERRVGKECVSTCTSPWSALHSKKNHTYLTRA